MARTTKRARTKVPPVIAKLLKTVHDLPLEDAVDELQLAWEEETSLEKRQTLMKARIKLLEDAQKPRRGAQRPRKKPARKAKVVEAEVIEEVASDAVEVAEAAEDAPTKKRGGTGTITALDLGGLGAMMGGDDDAEGGEGGAGSTAGTAGESDAAAQGDAAAAQATASDAAGADADTAGSADAATADGAIAMPPPDQAAGAAAAEATPPEPEEPKELEKPAYKKKKLTAPDYTGDEMYQQIWKEMQQEGIDKLTAVRMSGDDFDTRLEQTRKDADWLGFGAIRMGDSDWDQAANSIVFDCDHITADWQLDQRLNQGLSEMAALQGADAPDLPEVDVPEGAEAAEVPAADPAPAPEPEPEPAADAKSAPEAPAEKEPTPKAAPVDPMANMDALFAELGDDEEEAAPEETAEEAVEEATEPTPEPAAEEPTKEEVIAAPATAAEPAPEPDSAPVPDAVSEPEPAPEADPAPVPEATAPPAPEASTETDADVTIPTNDAGEKILTEDRYDVPFDPTPIEQFSDDPQYTQIWEDMVVEALENLGLAQRWKAEFDARLRRADDTAARLLHAAQQMQFEDYVHLLEDFAFDLPALDSDAALDQALAKMRADIEALRGDRPAVEIPATDNYTPPKPKAQTVPQKPDGDGDEMRKPPKPMVTDTDESAQTRDDWESEDFWSWDDEDGGGSAEANDVSAPTAPETEAPEAPKPDTAEPAAPTKDADEGYRAVWDDVVQETLEGLRLIRAAQDPFGDRLSQANSANERLRHAADQMDYAPWLEVLNTFAAKARLIGDATALDRALDTLLADLTLLHQGSAAVADLLKQPAAPAVSTSVQEARAAAQSRSGKATLDDIYKFFPKPE